MYQVLRIVSGRHNVLRLGGNTDRQRERVVAAFEKQKTTAEIAEMEYKMLNLFRKNPRQVLTRGQLLEKLWDIDEKYVDEHTLTTSISRIRSKIESDGGAPYIKTVYGMGYQWTGGEAK